MSRRCIPGAVGAHYTKLRTVRSNHVDALCALLDQLLTERSEAFVKHRPVIHLLGPDGDVIEGSKFQTSFVDQETYAGYTASVFVTYCPEMGFL